MEWRNWKYIITVILNEDWTYKDKSEIIDEMLMESIMKRIVFIGEGRIKSATPLNSFFSSFLLFENGKKWLKRIELKADGAKREIGLGLSLSLGGLEAATAAWQPAKGEDQPAQLTPFFSSFLHFLKKRKKLREKRESNNTNSTPSIHSFLAVMGAEKRRGIEGSWAAGRGRCC